MTMCNRENVYPWGVTKEDLDAFLSTHPERRDSILNLRTVVRKETLANLQHDLATLKKYPALDTLHPGLRQDLESTSRESAKAPRSTKSKIQHPTPRIDPILDNKALNSARRTLDYGFYAVPYAVAYADELMGRSC